MKKKHALALVLALFTAVGILGPRVNIDIALGEIILPDNLDLYLAESEARFDDITEGTEKNHYVGWKSRWENPCFDRFDPWFFSNSARIIALS